MCLLRLQRKLQLEVERREALCRHLSESESSLEMEEERHYNEQMLGCRQHTVSPILHNPSPSQSRPLSPGNKNYIALLVLLRVIHLSSHYGICKLTTTAMLVKYYRKLQKTNFSCTPINVFFVLRAVSARFVGSQRRDPVSHLWPAVCAARL